MPRKKSSIYNGSVPESLDIMDAKRSLLLLSTLPLYLSLSLPPYFSIYLSLNNVQALDSNSLNSLIVIM
jgi:hypothetical protein